jgi:hypothetical protein
LGVEQQHAFDLIRDFLSLAPIVKVPKCGFHFRLYIAAEDKDIWSYSNPRERRKGICYNISESMVGGC